MAQSFKDGMLAVKNALQASYSIENAIKEALEELELLHGKKDRIYKGFNKMINQLAINIPVEDVFYQFAQENSIEEICNFAEILRYAKRSGGNLAEIIKNTSEIITEKIEVKREIQVVTAAKRFEMLIMSGVPAAIILYMRLSSFNTMDKLYGNVFGVMVMTICLGIYGGSILLAIKISKIKM